MSQSIKSLGKTKKRAMIVNQSGIVLLHLPLFRRSSHQTVLTASRTSLHAPWQNAHVLAPGPAPLLAAGEGTGEGGAGFRKSSVHTGDGFAETHGTEEGTQGWEVGSPGAETHLDHDPECWVEYLENEGLLLVRRGLVAPAEPTNGVGDGQEDGAEDTGGGGSGQC